MSLDPLNSAQPRAAPLAVELADEANHRIANHLAVLAALMRLQAKGVGRTQIALSARDVQQLLEEFSGRLETVGEIHRLLAHRSNGAPVDVAGYLETRLQSKPRYTTMTRLQLKFATMAWVCPTTSTPIHCLFPVRVVLPAEQALALGLLVGELITNAVIYAHPAGVAGDCAGACVILDGKWPNGIRTIRLLAKQLGVSISFENHGLGLSCVVHIPCAARALKAVS
jgi:hypothetical protein